jgi:hypothetical protein
LEDYYSKKKDLETEIDQLQTKEREYQSELAKESKEIEQILAKQTTLNKKVSSYRTIL